MPLARSAFKDQQEAVQRAYDKGMQDAVVSIARWLEDRIENKAFAEVYQALQADFMTVPELKALGSESEEQGK